MKDIPSLTKLINKFVKERSWEKFQTPKDLAISISLEASEVLEHFQWKKDKEVKKHIQDNKDELADELADVAVYLFKLADKTGIDLSEAIQNKLAKAAKKFPVEAVKGDKRLEKYYAIKKQVRQTRKAK